MKLSEVIVGFLAGYVIKVAVIKLRTAISFFGSMDQWARAKFHEDIVHSMPWSVRKTNITTNITGFLFSIHAPFQFPTFFSECRPLNIATQHAYSSGTLRKMVLATWLATDSNSEIVSRWKRVSCISAQCCFGRSVYHYCTLEWNKLLNQDKCF